MNIRTATIYALSLCFAAAGVSCLSGISRGSRESDRDPSSVLDDLSAYAAASRTQCYRYEHYAERASVDGQRSAAGLFRALARSERIHEYACNRAAEIAGGRCEPPAATAFDIADTRKNMRRSLSDESTRLGASRGGAATRAISAGNYYAARVLIWIDATNRRHMEILERFLYIHNRDSLAVVRCEYAVCPVCGNIYEADNCDAYCPICRTPRSSFESFGPSLQLD